MGRRVYLYAIVLALGFGFAAVAQQPISSFKHITIDDGLSQNSVNCIHQDSYGFMWFGTQDGLNRYDGYEFVQYRTEHKNPNSLSNNYIWDLYEDDDKKLWIATFGGGLNCLDLRTGNLKHFKMDPEQPDGFPSNRIFSIVEQPKGILWIGSNEGIIRFDKSTFKSELFLAEKAKDNTLKDNYVGIVEADQYGNLWLRSESGLTYFNTKTLKAEFFLESPFSKTLTLGDIADIQRVNNKIYVLCKAGLLEINPELKSDKLLLASESLSIDGRIPALRRLLVLNNRQVVIGTNIGLIIHNRHTGKTEIYTSDALDDRSLTHGYVTSLFKSDDEVIWIGTRNGLNKIETLDPDFVHVRNIPGKAGLSSKNVNSFIKVNDSLSWIGTTDGLNLYNNRSNNFKVFRKNDAVYNGLKTNYILTLFEDSKGTIWIGTRSNGFYKINSNYQIEQINPNNADATKTSIHFIDEDKNGTLWLGTGGAGLWKYDPKLNTLKKYAASKDGKGPAHSYIFTILEDSFGNIWLGTPTGGLNLFDPVTEQFLYFQNDPNNPFSLSNDILLSLHEDSQQQLWIGTNGGLNKLLPRLRPNMFAELKSKQLGTDSLFSNFSKDQGFPNDVIYGMLEDDNNQLWISTNKGIVAFDMKSEIVNRSFDISHGLQSNEFNQNGYYKDDQGLFYFGGVDGFNMFHPDSISGNTYVPKVAITSLSLLNEPVEIGNKSNSKVYTLPLNLYCLDELSLSWKHDVITLDFVGLSYVSPEKNKYRYKLEGFKDEWIHAEDARSATYTNLAPGNYIFRVQAANSSGIWNEEGTALRIHISTPPWASWYAYLFYALFLGWLFYLFLRFRINRATEKIRFETQIEKARTQERETFRKRSSRDFHDEAGTKITRIALITELVKQQTKNNPQLQDHINQIGENLQDLNAGMRDFIWALDPSQDNVYDTLNRFTDFAVNFCEIAGIQFNSNEISNDLKALQLNMAQRRHTLLILKEALNNSVKHAKPSLITFKSNMKDLTLDLSLRDNGCGFDMSVTSAGHGLKNMQARAEAMGAFYNLTSKPGVGSEIRLKVLTTRMGKRQANVF